LGMLYETQGEMGKAISAYEKSIDNNRGFPPSRFRLGRLYERQGSDQKAVEQYARALEIDPEMRFVKRNPLVVDTKLLGLASLKTYGADLGRAWMAAGAGYVDTGLTKKLPVDRTLSSEDLKPSAGEATPAPIQVIGPSSSGPPSRQPVRPAPPVRHTAPAAPEPPPDLVVPAEPTAEPPPPAPLPTPDAARGRPPYLGRSAPPPPPRPGGEPPRRARLRPREVERASLELGALDEQRRRSHEEGHREELPVRRDGRDPAEKLRDPPLRERSRDGTFRVAAEDGDAG